MTLDFLEEALPPDMLCKKPKQPTLQACCGNGCSPCVYDVYEEELKIWRQECLQVLGKTTPPFPIFKDLMLSTTNYIRLPLLKITPVAGNCSIHRFAISTTQHLKVGEHLILRGYVEGEHVTRQYTPIICQESLGYFEVLIKTYEDGKMSQYIKTWKEGDNIEWRGPFGKFQYKPNSYRQILMLAAGTGITPMIQVIQQIIENEADETFIRLLFAAQSYGEIWLKNLLDSFKRNWNCRILYCLSQEHDLATKKYSSDIFLGRINCGLLREEIGRFQLENLFVLICGPKSFNEDMMQYLGEIQLPKDHWFVF